MSTTRAGFELDSGEYHADSETYRFEYDQDRTPPGMAAVAAVAEILDAEPTAVEPLYDTVDADALKALVGDRTPSDGDVQVTFSLDGFVVTVHSYGVVSVARPGAERGGDRNGETSQR